MNGNMKLDYEPLISMNQLLVRVLIRNGEANVFDRTIPGEDQEAVIGLMTDASTATGINSSEMEQAVADVVSKSRDWWSMQQQKTVEGYAADFITSVDLERMTAKHRWLIKRILVRDQPVLWGGPKKSLKTSVMIDAAISLGSGKKFLGVFDIPERVNVAVLSGESGQITIRETAMRIAKSKGIALSTCSVLWEFALPKLGVDEDVAALAKALKDNQVAVCFVDPAYLCLLAGSNNKVEANNMFSIGPLLMRVAKECQEIGATLILVHHTTKPAGMLRMQTGDPLELEDLAYAGFQEFARQWVLINRRQKYEPGSGKHALWLNVGGSAGQSGCWGVDIDEGILPDDFSERSWRVEVQTMETALKQVADAKKSKKEADKEAKVEEAKQRALQVLSGLVDGETATGIAKLAGIDMRWITPALADLAMERRVVVCEILKRSGRGGSRGYSGFRLAYPVNVANEGRVASGAEDASSSNEVERSEASAAGGDATDVTMVGAKE